MLPALIAALIITIAAVVLYQQIRALDMTELRNQLVSMPRSSMMGAVGLTLLNYIVLTGYDRLGLGWMKVRLAWWRAAPTAFVAFAIGHNVGFAALSGGALRYRGYRALGVPTDRIAGVIAFCTVSFFLGAAGLLGSLLLSFPGEFGQRLSLSSAALRVVGLLLLSGVVAYLVWSVRTRPVVRLGQWHYPPPAPSTALLQIALAATDLCLAASVLYVLLPDSVNLLWPNVVGLYLVAVSVSLISNVPGGLGVFESAMLLMLPTVPVAELLGSLLVFRAVFYLMPFVLAVAVLVADLFLYRQHQR